MSYEENEYLMLSGLQHYLFCPRQWALIHIEQLWSENLFTAQGRVMHETVHSAKTEQRGNIRISRTLKLVSYSLGLTGQADMVEFHRVAESESGITLNGQKGLWRVFPVEYKHGKPKTDHSDEVQLCAQAICLEEMLATAIPEGAIYYGRQHRRYPVSFDPLLRKLTESTASKIHELLNKQETPPAEYSKKCHSCSLLDQCLPDRTGRSKNVRQYVAKMMDENL